MGLTRSVDMLGQHSLVKPLRLFFLGWEQRGYPQDPGGGEVSSGALEDHTPPPLGGYPQAPCRIIPPPTPWEKSNPFILGLEDDSPPPLPA